METDKKNLTPEELEQVSGGTGDQMGKWLIGDLFSIKRDITTGDRRYLSYFFCTLTGIVNYNGGTRYVMQCEWEAEKTGSFYTVSEHKHTYYVDSRDSYSPVIIKKIYDFPDCRLYNWEDLAKWVV